VGEGGHATLILKSPVGALCTSLITPPLVRMNHQVKDYKRFNLDLELQMHVAMLEFGVRSMPPGVTTFIIVADSSNLGVKQISLGLMQVHDYAHQSACSHG
jgi:hypothetical protein